jgi:signal transduction histidine kinase
MRDAAGEIMVGMVVCQDLSQRQALEQQHQEFITLVAHELGNGLTAVKGNLQLLQRRQVYDERLLARVVSQVNHVQRMIHDLRESTRVAAGRLELVPGAVDLVALVRECVDSAPGRTDAHRIAVEAPARPIVGWWDRDRVTQVLQNLLSNAIKYSPDGGVITVQVVPGEAEAGVSVRDQGVGIPASELPRLFENFYRSGDAPARAVQGLGLGLHVTRALVEAHGGRIWATSDGPNRGSTFSFSLPYGAAPS